MDPEAVAEVEADGLVESEAELPVVESLAPQTRAHFQVRFEQRIVIRVPRRTSDTAARASLSAVAPPPPPSEPRNDVRLKPRKIGKCVAMNEIAGVQVWSDDSLMLYMRDNRLIRAELENACRARDFYQGFYMEKSKDGNMCVERDVLQARSGSKCEVEKIRQMVVDKD
ncbi:MAG: hypothetical protein R3E02_14610 [Blastomonas sp.]